MKFVVLGLALASVVSNAQSSKVDHVLDVVGYRMTPDTSGAETGGISAGSSGSGSQTKVPALTISLVEIERRMFETGESFIYVVTIKNVADRALQLPWSPDIARFTSGTTPTTGVVSGSIFLEARSAVGGKRLAWLEPQLLFGSSGVDGSLETLRPGEQATIRLTGAWRMSQREATNVLAEPNGIVDVAAVFHLQPGGLISSTNVFEVSLRDRLKR